MTRCKIYVNITASDLYNQVKFKNISWGTVDFIAVAQATDCNWCYLYLFWFNIFFLFCFCFRRGALCFFCNSKTSHVQISSLMLETS